MRVISDIWVSAFLRSAGADGAYVTVLRRGATEAGAIFLVHSRPDRTYAVYAPAPQTAFEPGMAADRLFERVADAFSESELQDYVARQVRFDPDCWVVEFESRDLPGLLPLADS